MTIQEELFRCWGMEYNGLQPLGQRAIDAVNAIVDEVYTSRNGRTPADELRAWSRLIKNAADSIQPPPYGR